MGDGRAERGTGDGPGPDLHSAAPVGRGNGGSAAEGVNGRWPNRENPHGAAGLLRAASARKTTRNGRYAKGGTGQRSGGDQRRGPTAVPIGPQRQQAAALSLPRNVDQALQPVSSHTAAVVAWPHVAVQPLWDLVGATTWS